jgi:hypothetical protein
MAVICQLHETGLRCLQSVFALCQLLEAGWRLSVSCMMHDSGRLQDVCVYFVCYLKRNGGNLSVT